MARAIGPSGNRQSRSIADTVLQQLRRSPVDWRVSSIAAPKKMKPKINFIERERLFRRELKRRKVRFLPMQVLRRLFEKAGV